MDKPTFNPSMLVNKDLNNPDDRGNGYVRHRCHSFVRDGKIQFLNDCTHELKGQTVSLEPF